MSTQADGDSHPPDDDGDSLDPLELAAVRKLLFRGAGGEEDETGEFQSDATDVIDAVGKLLDRIDSLEDQVTELQAQLETETNRAMGTKIAQAKRLARDDLLRQWKRLRNLATDPNIDQPTVTTMARASGREINASTVYDGFEELRDEWECFEVVEGDPGPDGRNKRLVIRDRSDIPDPLWAASDVESP